MNKKIKGINREIGSKVVGIGAYRPKNIIPNQIVADLIDSSDDWIRERSGIIERRFADINETVVEMGVKASLSAIAGSGIDPKEIDLVILATATNPSLLPNLSMQIASEIGASNSGAFDVGAACAGFTYSLAIANSSIISGDSKHVLVIGSERMSDFVSKYDRSTAFLFGDGAGAFLISKSDYVGISNTVWGSDGSLKDWIKMSKSWKDVENDTENGFPYLKMEGQKVFRWAITEMVDIAKKTLLTAGIDVDDLSAFVPHQANQRITEHIAKSLNLPAHVAIARDGVNMGNTTAATIPLAIESLRKNGQCPSGGLALLLGFGAGLAYSGQVIEIP